MEIPVLKRQMFERVLEEKEQRVPWRLLLDQEKMGRASVEVSFLLKQLVTEFSSGWSEWSRTKQMIHGAVFPQEVVSIKKWYQQCTKNT